MSLTHELLSVDGNAVLLTIPFANEQQYSKGLKIIVQNLDQSKHVLLGSSSVTTSSYGHKLDPLKSIELELSPWDELYAHSDTGSLLVGVIRISR